MEEWEHKVAFEDYLHVMLSIEDDAVPVPLVDTEEG
jgi:hypothetical protein